MGESPVHFQKMKSNFKEKVIEGYFQLFYQMPAKFYILLTLDYSTFSLSKLNARLNMVSQSILFNNCYYCLDNEFTANFLVIAW